MRTLARHMRTELESGSLRDYYRKQERFPMFFTTKVEEMVEALVTVERYLDQQTRRRGHSL